jgi:APA family basic amino acid/polyamine antiporter
MNSNTKFARSLGLGYVIVVVVGNIIGSGVYKKIAPMAAELHSSEWVLIAWIVAGLITLFGALGNAEVAGLLADTGGDFSYYKKIYNRFFAFIYGWSLFTIIQTASISSLAYVFAQSLNNLVPLPELFLSLSNVSLGGVFFPFAGFAVKLTAILLIVLLTIVNIKGIKSGALVSKLVLILVFTGIFLIIVFGLGSEHSTPASTFDFRSGSGTTVTISAFFTAMLAAFWAYQGWATVGFIGGEVKDAKRNIPKGIIIGVFMVIIIYLLINITYLSLLPVSDLEKIYESGNQIAAVEAVRTFWGDNGALFISVLILISTLGCTNATILASPRVNFAMARENLFFSGAGTLNKSNAPANSLILQGIWASVLVLSGTFDQLTDMIIFAVFIFYGATSLAVFILRRRMPDAPRPYKVWGYPVVPAIFITFCIVLVFNTFFTRPREAIFGLALIFSGLPVFWYLNRKKTKSRD